jgi:uncharacterized protein (TIGR00730 family)
MDVCVYCGSSPGSDPVFLNEARSFGTLLAELGHGVVYGGGNVGLMGAVADAALAAGGRVTGVMPRHLIECEVAHRGLTQLHEVGSMHERKALMAELADAFVALPGGPGTFEEIFEAWVWALLGLHTKPCALLNGSGYYDQLLGFLQNSVTSGFVRQPHRDMLIVEQDGRTLLGRLETYVAPLPKWAGSRELPSSGES